MNELSLVLVLHSMSYPHGGKGPKTEPVEMIEKIISTWKDGLELS